MGFKITTMAAMFLLFAITLIQVIPSSSREVISLPADPVPKDNKIPVLPTIRGDEIAVAKMVNLKKLLAKNEYLEKITEIFKIAKESAVEAKKKIETYSKETMPEDLRKLLQKIADKPQEMWEEVKPLLIDLNDTFKEMDRKFKETSVFYRMIARPTWSFLIGVGYVSASTVGYMVETAANLLQLFNDRTKESIDAYHYGAEPNKSNGILYNGINSALERFKGMGITVGNFAKGGLEKKHNTVKKPSNKSTPNNNESDIGSDSSVQPDKVVKIHSDEVVEIHRIN